MRSIKYKWTDPLDGNPKSIEGHSLLEFVYNVVGITESGILPPIAILNDRLRSGGECNPFGNVTWQPFEISSEEYERLCLAIDEVAPVDVPSHKGISFVKLKRAAELDDIHDSVRWTKVVCERFSDEYVENLMRLNANEPLQSDETEEHAPSHSGGADTEAPKRPDFGEIHEILLDLSRFCIEKFASQHREDRFYALGFDLHAEYGTVLLCANTESDFHKTAQRYIEQWQYDREDLSGLKRNFGDWLYQGFNLDYSEWNQQWDQCSLQIETYIFDDRTGDTDRISCVDEFIRTCSIVLLELEESGVFVALGQEPGFFTQCVDHDEDVQTADRRYLAYRKERGGACRGE